MKKCIMICLLLTVSQLSNGQVIIALLFGDKLNTGKMEFGIVVTPAFSGLTNIESKLRNGLNLGIYFNFNPDKKFYLRAEGIAKGAFGAEDIPPYSLGDDTLDALYANGGIERKIKVFSLPLMARYALSKKFHLEGGIQPNLTLGVKDIFQAKVHDNDMEYTVKVTDEYTKLDFCVLGGLFYKFRKDKRSMGIGGRYVYGLTDIYKTMPGTQANTAWQIVITIPVGAAPKNETENTVPKTNDP